MAVGWAHLVECLRGMHEVLSSVPGAGRLGTWEAEGVGGCEFKVSLKSETLFQKPNEKLTAFTLVWHLPALLM